MNTRKQYKYLNVALPKEKNSRERMKRITKKIGGTAATARGKIFAAGLAEYERLIAEGKEPRQ
jgi:hypothetical protein